MSRPANSRDRRQFDFIFKSRANFDPVRREKVYDVHHIFPQVESIIEYLVNFRVYRKQGLTCDKGALFWGPPGAGKTLFSQLVATESKARFIDARQFPVELKSGVHAWQPRDITNLFAFAARWVRENNHPIVLFIDQFDDFLKIHRNITSQLEIALEGFSNSMEGVFMIATSKLPPHKFGKSLFRSGRIGIHVAFTHPDRYQQAELLRGFLHTRPHARDIDVESLVYLLSKATPASIKFRVAEAHRLALHEQNLKKAKGGRRVLGKPPVTEEHLIKVFLSRILDPPSGYKISLRDREIVRIHEIGHYIVARALGFPAHFVSVRTGLQSLGETFVNGGNSERHVSLEEVKRQIAVNFGGAEAEKIFGYPEHINAMGDLDASNTLAKDLVGVYGYKKRLRRKYGSVLLGLDHENTSREAMSDLEKLELKGILEEEQLRARRVLRFFGRRLIQRVAKVLGAKSQGVMLQKELDRLLEPKLSQFHRLHKILDQIKEP